VIPRIAPRDTIDNGREMSGEAELWGNAPLELSLPSNRIDVWRVGLDTPKPSDRASCAVLSPDEVSRAGRFRFPCDRVRFVAWRTALRNILGRYLRVSPAEPTPIGTVSSQSAVQAACYEISMPRLEDNEADLVIRLLLVRTILRPIHPDKEETVRNRN
jgi:hypothetical protein